MSMVAESPEKGPDWWVVVTPKHNNLSLETAGKVVCTFRYLPVNDYFYIIFSGKSPHARKIVLTNLNQNSALFIQTLQSDLVTAETIARRGDLTFIDPYKAVYHYRKHGEEFPRFISKYGNTVEVYLGPVKNHVIKPSNLCERMELPVSTCLMLARNRSKSRQQNVIKI